MSATLKYSEVNSSKISFATLKGYTLIKYDNNELCIQSPWINLFFYGIPRKDKFNPTDNSRKCIKIPLDLQDPEVIVFVDMLKDIDAKMGSTEVRKAFLGDNSEKFEYSSMFKESQTENRPSNIKLKLDTEHDDDLTIKTRLYKTKINKNGSVERQLIQGVTNIDDFSNIVAFKSDIRFIFKIIRCWSQAPNIKNPTYGLTLKVTKIEVKAKSEEEHYDVEFIDDVVIPANGHQSVSTMVLDDQTVAAMLAIVKNDFEDNPKHYDISSDGSGNSEDDLCKKINGAKLVKRKTIKSHKTKTLNSRSNSPVNKNNFFSNYTK
jgi:hypothetical protein